MAQQFSNAAPVHTAAPAPANPSQPPSNAAGVSLPPNPQMPATLADITHALDYRRRLEKSRGSAHPNAATVDEIGSARVYETELVLSYQTQSPAAPLWLQDLARKVDNLSTTVNNLTTTVNTLSTKVDAMQFNLAEVSALAENTRRVLRNQKAGRGNDYVPLKKWKFGTGIELARALLPTTVIQDPPITPAIGELPAIVCSRPTTLTNLNISELMVFYNDDFGIVGTDDVIDASVVRTADIQASHPDLKMTIDPTDFTRLRFVVVLQNNRGDPRRLRLFQWNDLGVEKWRTMNKDTSAKLAGGWDQALIFAVEQMSPIEVDKMLGRM
ncbi:hypothetical protein D9615_009622 [Tricholomella constricta]|uniref:Uncharacterized protein n=1 Tax=Tricholomella constricta TaxID=117010 RepID=A0A8H5LVF7_9AGAR|nr:hypothetical protein D9615_009622 [Tricholomella constricta]